MEKVEKNWPAVLSLTILSFITNIYIIFLAGTALGFWCHCGKDELRKLFHAFDTKRNEGPLGILLFSLIFYASLLGLHLLLQQQVNIFTNALFAKTNIHVNLHVNILHVTVVDVKHVIVKDVIIAPTVLNV